MITDTTSETGEMRCEFRGTRGALFRIAMRNAVLNALTLGIYQFWGKTRVRKYFWSALAPGGDSLEYTGTGVEKLSGFLMAVAVLAVSLGLSQLLLGFAGLSIFSDGGGDQTLQVLLAQITLLTLVPLYFYARYRAWRTVLACTRWRGIRFGMEPGAWGYVWRAVMHSVLTILSLGLLLPRQTFWLEKYRTDRTWYGTARFCQNGRWHDLYPAMKHLIVAVVLLAAVRLLMGPAGAEALALLAVVGVLWLGFGWVYYATRSFEILMQNKSLAGGIEFIARPRARKVARIVLSGVLLTLLCLALLVSGFSLVAVWFAGATSFADLINGGSTLQYDGTTLASLAVLIAGYLVALLFSGALFLVFVRQPLVAYYASTLTIRNAGALQDIEQQRGDEMPQAQG